ncbi:conserved exported hypothetical protein [Mesorhizobium plurifarium]|uniref:TIGR02301 family protein n=1 Tax=Mesorhizobium plurifarium TaxID=69974 RepID=A0A090GJA1_MESPL|nr:conserved exported hypothetical protein [Mesorhizobium plurifarium]
MSIQNGLAGDKMFRHKALPFHRKALMTRASAFLAACLAVSVAAAPPPARAAEAPFEPGLMRLAEVLGSLHFLRNLCGEKGDQWRIQMEKLLESENPDPDRRARFIASFNRGYRSFSGTYTQCTPSATAAIARYMKEGETLSRDIASRYGN